MAQPFAGSYIPTAGGTAARNRDQLNFPFDARPQAATMYLRFLEQGTIHLTATTFVAIVANSGGTATAFGVSRVSGANYRVTHQNDTDINVVSTLGSAPVMGDLVELIAQLYADGAVQIHQTLNGGSETSATKSAALLLNQTWGGNLLWFNGLGSANYGFIGLRNAVLCRGVKDLAQMRRAARVT